MPSPVITVDQMNKSYPSLKAVNDLSFEVQAASCFGFLGPNGAGKTTTMKMLYGKALRDSKDGGEVNVFGFDPAVDELKIKTLLGVVPQEDNLDEELDVLQNLTIYARFYGLPTSEAASRIEDLINFMELTEKKQVRIRELSGGMKRRLVIARALLHSPKLLILDEPTTGLDPQVRHLIWSKIRELKENGVTILLTTHYMEEAFQICDRIIIMDRGTKLVEGEPQELLDAHVEQFVLEIRNFKTHDARIPEIDSEMIRKDDSHQMPLFYSNDWTALKNLSSHWQRGEYHLRQSNLEDLFLKITGRSLNDDQ